jgi:hypothetical protein
MRTRLTPCAAALALALIASPAAAQDPTLTPSPSASPTPSATPTPSPTPTPEEQERAERDARDRKARTVRRIYRDFESDGRIDDCDHTERALKRARRSIEDSYKEEYPDFRQALTAAIERHESGRCEEQEQELEDRNSDPTPTATPAPGGGGTTPAPAPAPAPAPPPTTPDSGALPDFGAGGGSGGGSGPGGDDPVDPLPEAPGEDAIPEGTPAPTPAVSPTPTPPPKLIVTRAAASPDMFVPGALLAVALLGLLFAALSALASKRGGRLAGVGHAWREAAWRTSGAWSDFGDWLRARR